MQKNRIDQIEKWLFQLDLPPLSEREAEVLLVPEEAEVGEVFKDLEALCARRFSWNSFWPDFRVIGYESKKEMKKKERIFAIGL